MLSVLYDQGADAARGVGGQPPAAGDACGGVTAGSVWARRAGPGRPPAALDGSGFLVVTEVYPGLAGKPAYCLAKSVDGTGIELQSVTDLAAACDRVGDVGDAAGMCSQDWRGEKGLAVRAAAFELALGWLAGDRAPR